MVQPNSKNTTILFVDDEIDFREALAYSFARKGYNVLTAASGQEAFKIIQSQPVNVVVSDICMPNGTGIELLDLTKERHPETPLILLVTGFTDISTEEAHNKGAEALFSKPFNLNVLEEAIENLLIPPEKRWGQNNRRPDTEIKVQLRFKNLNSAIESKAVSLGRGGMFVSLSENAYPTINDEVTFDITFDQNEKSLEGNGIIRWIRTRSVDEFSSGIGIEFTYLGEDERKQIIEYVSSRKLKMYIPNK